MTQVNIFDSADLECLSNFAPGFGFWADGKFGQRFWWPSAEHFLQAGKFEDPALQERIRQAKEPGEAKALGRRLEPLRADWDEIKRNRVRQAMLEKLFCHQAPREALLGIPKGARIINGNPADPYFGTGPDGNGSNIIGLELESLRTLLTTFPKRQRLILKVASVGEPFEPFTSFVDLTGIALEEVAKTASEVLGVSSKVIEDIDFVIDDFDKSNIGDFGSTQELHEFLVRNYGDCHIEVHLASPAIVTLWDGTTDNFLARAELNHLCPSLELLEKRLLTLQPLASYANFSYRINVCINEEEETTFQLDEHSYSQAVSAGAEMADVVISLTITMPSETQPSLLPPPSDPGPPRAIPGDHSCFEQAELVDRVRGVVWGAALGDAVGLATEFMKKHEVTEHYPDPSKHSPIHRISDKHRARWTAGDWTDDTDQLVLVLDAVVAGRGLFDQKVFAESLQRWGAEGFPELGDTRGLGMGQTVNGVLEHPAFAIAPDIAAEDVWRRGGCTMAANGAVMRCAGAALTYFWDEATLEYNAAASASVTHADPRCVASCVAVATLIGRTLMGVDQSDDERRKGEVALAATNACRHLKNGDADDLWKHMLPESLESLQLGDGGIGYTYKSLGAACWAFLEAKSFKESIIAVTREAGDADSNAAVAGAVLGARLGYSGLPQDWLAELPEPQVKWMHMKVDACLRLLQL